MGTANTRSRRTRARASSNFSTKEKGDRFEKEVADLFRCFPGATVTEHKKVGGKDVDVFVVLPGPLASQVTLVVDAKDYEKPMTRDATSAEYSSYYPLVANKNADQFVLVTRNGIVANAKECFDGKASVHYTFAELQNHVINPAVLVDHMESQFADGKLNEYYTPPFCYDIDLEKAIRSYHLYFNEFVSFSVSNRLYDLDRAGLMWRAKGGLNSELPALYDSATFKDAFSFRERRKATTDIEGLVDKWLADDACTLGLALLGTYGTGKSSFARRMAHKAARAFKVGRSNRIPLLIELKEFGSHQSIEGLITHILVNRYAYRNGSFLLFKKMNQNGRYFLILDGFDEMKQGMTRDALAYNFSEINSLCAGRSKVMLCGRPTIFEDEEEQAAILSGGRSLHLPTQAKYLPVEIAPLTEGGIVALASQYVQAVPPDNASNMTEKLKQVEGALKTQTELRGLLSRPVHIPMFITVLPSYTGDLSAMNRGALYKSFIDSIICREVFRLPFAYQRRYTSAQRFDFAELLALEMAKKGEIKSIRVSEIPDSILEPYIAHGENSQTVRRDLVAACFLERKPPDILSFGHKSFLEFLFASRMVSLLRSKSTISSGDLYFGTYEMQSFALDLLSIDDIDAAFAGPEPIRKFVLDCMTPAFETIAIPDARRWLQMTPTEIRRKASNALPRSRRTRDLLQVRIRPRAKPMLERITSSQILAQAASYPESEAIADKLPVIFALYRYSNQSRGKVKPASWRTILDLASSDSKVLVARLAMASGDLDDSTHAAMLECVSSAAAQGAVLPRVRGSAERPEDTDALVLFVDKLYRPTRRLTIEPIQ